MECRSEIRRPGSSRRSRVYSQRSRLKESEGLVWQKPTRWVPNCILVLPERRRTQTTVIRAKLNAGNSPLFMRRSSDGVDALDGAALLRRTWAATPLGPIIHRASRNLKPGRFRAALVPQKDETHPITGCVSSGRDRCLVVLKYWLHDLYTYRFDSTRWRGIMVV